MLNLAPSCALTSISWFPAGWGDTRRRPEGQIKRWREGNTQAVYIEEINRNSFTTEESATAKTNRGLSAQRVVYLCLNVNLNIHLTTMFCPTHRLLLICFSLHSPPWLTQNHRYTDVREGLAWLLLPLQPVCFRQLLTWVRDRETDRETKERLLLYGANG